jgi:predicted NBD/HSP70 family sugar kinase
MDRPVKATLRETREHNERLVLATIYDAGRVSRADVARSTGLTRTTVSDVTEGLIAAGLCREVGRGPSTGGKAPILLEVPEMARLLVGVDLGDRVFTAATVNLRGEIIDRVDVSSEDANGEAALELALDVIGGVLATAAGPILGIGIGAPGLVDRGSGVVIQAVKRDWRNLRLASIVSDRFGLAVQVANDSQAAGLAEHVFGAVRGLNLVTVKVGQGIGAGLVLNGELFEGDGCLETVASTRAVLQKLAARRGHPVSLDAALDSFRSGDAETRELVIQAGRSLGAALAAIVGMLHVRRFVLAGTMTSFGDTWLDAVASAASDRALAALGEDTTFEIGRMDDVVVLGASALLMTRELGMSLRPLGESRRFHAPESAADEATASLTPSQGASLIEAATGTGGVAG